MTHGAGKYDEACTTAREATGAVGVVLIVYGGRLGHGFSVQVPPEFLRELPQGLRLMADAIEKDNAEEYDQ